jgi:SDR family mycofactocin-dependent oxidoreductase
MTDVQEVAVTGRVAGKVAFITGAARGQGRSHAVRLAQEGADIIALDICAPVGGAARFYPPATEGDLAQTVREVEALDRRIVARQADVRDFAAVDEALRAGVAELGHVDIVAANAGIFQFGSPAHEESVTDWDENIAVNLTGVWNTVRAAAPLMIAQGTGGSIVLTSSTAGLKGTPNLASYTAAKHGVVGLMRTLALELGKYQIRVNTLHPTGVATPMGLNDAIFRLFLPDLAEPTRADFEPIMAALNVLPVACIEPVDVSNALLFLASDEARYITGAALPVDAGALAK